jgi:outer membrane lipoprotein-sorting protein
MRLLATLIIALATSNAFAVTAEELAEKNVAARGGLDKVHAIKTLRLTGHLKVQGDTLELGYVALIREPGSIRYEATLQGLTQVQAFDGSQAWQINPFQGRKDPEKLSADDAKGLGEDAADFAGPLVDYKAKDYKLDYLGTEDVDGTEAHKLRITRKNGDLTTVWLDPDYFLEIRTVNRRIEHGVPIEYVTDYGDYEKVDGVYMAFYQESGVKSANERQKLQVDKAEANVTADGSQFSFPVAPAGNASGK